MSTPMKTPRHSRTKSSDSCKYSENLQPNIPIFTPSKKSTPSKKIASRSATKPRNPAVLSPPPPPLRRERKFVIAKKNNSTKQANDLEAKKRQEAAYEKLRASQEEFFKKDIVPVLKSEASKNGEEKEELQKNESLETKTKSMVMEEAMKSIPEPGSGRVKHIVKAFESLLSISDGEESGKKERKNILMDWLMPNLPPKVEQSNGCECPSSLGPSSVELFPVRGHEREPRLCSSADGLDERLSLTSRTSGGGRKSRRHSLDSSRKSWNKRLKVTNLQPFKLRTELRGRLKEHIFVKKVTEMLLEEEKKRIPIAQGIPWTIDEPECLIKPPVKECTEPLEIVLHSDVRAVERAEFDQYVTERLELAKQFKLERQTRQKMEEEEEIRRLRRELVPRAQPMPYFDRPFMPKKSAKPRTVPKEPKFHVRPVEDCVCLLGRCSRIQ